MVQLIFYSEILLFNCFWVFSASFATSAVNYYRNINRFTWQTLIFLGCLCYLVLLSYRVIHNILTVNILYCLFKNLHKTELSAIHGEKRRDCFGNKTPRNDTLRKTILSLRAKRSNLKTLHIHRELLLNCPFT